MNLTDKEYEKIITNLDEYVLEDGESYDMEEYLDAFSDKIDKELLKLYFSNKEFTTGDVKDIIAGIFDAFIEKLDPVGAENKYSFLVNKVRNEKTGEIEEMNHSAFTLREVDMTKKAAEIANEDYLVDASIKYFNESLKNGEQLSDREKTKFFDIPVNKTVKNTDKIFNAIFNVEKSNDELDKLKKDDEEQYKEESKGKTPLDEKNIEKALDSYKMLNDKVKKMSIIEVLFHLPSYFKLKNNIKNFKEKMVNKGISEKLIDGVVSGEENIKGSFEKNKEYTTGVKQIDKEANAKIMNDITKKAERIQKSNEVSQAKAHSTSTKHNVDKRKKAREHYDKMKQLEEKLATFNQRMEKGTKYVSDNQTKLENERIERENLFNEYEAILDKLTNVYKFDFDEIGRRSTLSLDDPKAKYSKADIDSINLCKEYIDKRQKITSLDSSIHSKEKELEPNGDLDIKKRKLELSINSVNHQINIEKAKLAKYLDIKLEELPDKLPQIDKMFKKKENDSPLLFDPKELKKNSEIIIEGDEEDYEDEKEDYEDEKEVENNVNEIENDNDLRKQLGFDANTSPLIPLNNDNNKSFISEKDIEIENKNIKGPTND